MSFTCEPHIAIVGEPQGVIVNLVDANAKSAQTAILATVREKPARTLREARLSRTRWLGSGLSPGLGAGLLLAGESGRAKEFYRSSASTTEAARADG